MATKVFMEALSPTMEEGRLVKWLKKEGDVVKSGDPLAEVETDKAIMELVARGDGVLRKLLIKDGESRPVGQLVGVIASKDENIDAMLAEAGGGAAAATKAPEKVVAETQEQAGASPVPSSPKQAQGEASAPPQEKVAASRPSPTPDVQRPASDAGNGERARSSPLARRMATDRGLDISSVQGSGPGGRIIKRDIEAAAATPTSDPARLQGAPERQTAGVSVPRGGADYQDVALTQIRKTIARRLAESIGPIPTFYLTAEFDLTRVVEMREAMLELGDEFKVSINDVLLKATATALAQHPEVNAHWLGDRIRTHNRVHLGMAVATDEGLIVPVIFDADRKRLSEISAEARQLATLARERKLKPEQYTGSTFSLSNLGMMQIDQFTAIINPPEVGILAVGTAEDQPIVVDGELRTRKRVRLTMSCDHRAVDGAVGARFLVTLRRLIENPLMLVY
jgi:pyruvate dehydrogenase E2 component (dihydrolipoamide acetyltransferase)